MTNILIIAGSDSGGGAGVQADIRTVLAHHCHPLTAITALTAQSPKRVTAIHPAPPEIVREQIRVVIEDMGASAIKIGMLANAAITHAVADMLETYADIPVILDPVMIATSGALLLEDEAVACVKSRLIPRALIVTPNIPEAAHLTQQEVQSVEDMETAATALKAMGAHHVLVKGGHLTGDELTDLYMGDNGQAHRLSTPRLHDVDTHGTGCRLASAIASRIGKGGNVLEAVKGGIAWLGEDLLSS